MELQVNDPRWEGEGLMDGGREREDDRNDSLGRTLSFKRNAAWKVAFLSGKSVDR